MLQNIIRCASCTLCSITIAILVPLLFCAFNMIIMIEIAALGPCTLPGRKSS